MNAQPDIRSNYASLIIAGRKSVTLLILILLFVFRLLYGITSEFWFEDELQIYLIGLQFYTTGVFPWFGPDVVYTSSQIPGALQGLLTGIPFYLWPVPEAPYILLNLISFFGLLFLAWYIKQRIPALPAWFVIFWIFTCPWVMNYSTHIVNPSYLLFSGVIFLIGFLESSPAFCAGRINPRFSFFFMGFALTWTMQLHMSWVLLLPFIGFAFINSFVMKNGRLWLHILSFFSGLLLPALLLIPVYMKFGWHDGSGGTGSNIVFNPSNALHIVDVVSRFLSFASFELPRFMGPGTKERLALLQHYLPFAPFLIFAGLVGILQPLWLAVSFFRKAVPGKIRVLILLTMLLIGISFLFSVKGPSSHTFYILFPFAMLYSMYAWSQLFTYKWFCWIMACLILSGFIVHGVLMHRNYYDRSMYLKRELPLNAIRDKNHLILGERRGWDRNGK